MVRGQLRYNQRVGCLVIDGSPAPLGALQSCRGRIYDVDDRQLLAETDRSREQSFLQREDHSCAANLPYHIL